jgi:hypothetical protein
MKRGTQKIKSKPVDWFTLYIYIPNELQITRDQRMNSPTAIIDAQTPFHRSI